MPEVAYRLSIAPELEAFRPEIEHVCRFLDDCYLLRRASEAERVLYYGSGGPANAVAVPAVLFPAGVRVDGKGIHPDRAALKRMLQSGELLSPKGAAHTPLGYDAIGLIFFMLSRIEERGYLELDRYQRFPVTAALIQPIDGRLYPLADQAAFDIAARLTGEADPPRRTRYEVLFTHDVDILRGYHKPFEPLRNAAGDALKRLAPVAAVRRLHHAYFRNEPWTSIRRLMDLAERSGIKSRFYLMGTTDDEMGSPYVLRYPELLRQVTNEIQARGHVLGYHPGYYTYDDAAEWIRQRDGVEAVVGTQLREGRHHVLRYDCAVTPRIWSDAGMRFDCTLSYPETVGFRSGTCRFHHAYDLVARRTLPLKHLSTAVMEFGLFGGKYRDLSVEQGIDDSVWALEICRKFGGSFTILFHTGQDEPKLWAWAEGLLERAVN